MEPASAPAPSEPSAEAVSPSAAPLADRRALRVEAVFLAAVAVAAVVLTFWALQLWRADLRFPFQYDGDGLIHASYFKSLGENGTFLRTPRLGAPGGLELYDFPLSDGLHVLLVRLLGVLMPAYPVAFNVFYLLTYPLAAVAAAWTLRRLRVGLVPAAVAGLLFAVLPYHFVRGEGHLFLSAYYLVPPALLLALECASPAPPLGGERDENAFFFGRHPVWALAMCVLVASSDVYYGFFAAFFIVVGCAFGFARYRGRRHLVAAAALLGVILAATVLNVAPNIVYRVQNGPNTTGFVRNPGQAEVYGLKFDQMLLPADGHRVAKLAALKATYHAGMQRLGKWSDNEAVSASALGVIGAGGLVWLFGWFFVAFARGPDLSERGETLGRMGLFALSGFVLATVGGLSAVVAFVMPQIRSYNRMSVCLGFFALGAVAFGLDRLGRDRGMWVMVAAAAAVLVVGALDQVPLTVAQPYEPVARAYAADDAFVARVEGALPKSSAVLQLPYMPYPEPGGMIGDIAEYEPLKPYLHSKTLRWSYASMKGRPTDAMVKGMSALPAPELLPAARKAGFAAVWLDTAGYADRGAAMRAELTAAGAREMVISTDGRYVVFRL